MFEVPRTMPTLDQRGLLFGGKHVLASLCPETGRPELEEHAEPVLIQLSAGYMRPMDERTASLLKSAAKAWNKGDDFRAAYDLIQVRLPDKLGNTDFYQRLELVGKALAAGHSPDDISKALNMGLPHWMTEAGVPKGDPEGGEWTADGSGEIIDVATGRHGHHSHAHSPPKKRRIVPVSALPETSLDALRQAMKIEGLPSNQFDDLAWIMAQESTGVVGAHTQIRAQPGHHENTAAGLFQLIQRNWTFYPNGGASIGNPVEECQGAIRYMLSRYDNAGDAKAYWLKQYHKNGQGSW